MKKTILHSLLVSLFISGLTIGSLQAQNVGDAAPDFSLQTLKGTTFTLSAHKGKVVFVFLFGNSCSHCVANGPNTQKIYQKFMSDPNFVAIGVDVWNGTSNSVISYKNRTGISYNLAINGSSLTSNYGTTYDRILIIDQEGILHYKATSNATSGVAAIVEDKLETLLKAGATGINDSEITEKEFKVYPNPVSSIATIQTSIQAGTTVGLSLVDITGRTVLFSKREVGNSGEMSLEVTNYTSGLYFLRIKDDKQTFTSKILIE